MLTFFLRLVALTLIVTTPAFAEPLAPITTLTKIVEGRTVSIPIMFRPIPDGDAELIADLSDGVQKLNDVVAAAWSLHKLDMGGKLDYRGSIVEVVNGAVRIKVHFYARPPSVPNSKGSIILIATPLVQQGAIALSATASDLRISNDVTRIAVRAWNLDRSILNELNAALGSLLAADGAHLEVPAAVGWFGYEIKTAVFGTFETRPSLIVTLRKK